jgi:hypothetical protein
VPELVSAVICEDGVCSVDTPDKQGRATVLRLFKSNIDVCVEVKNPIETFLRFGSIKKGTQRRSVALRSLGMPKADV